MSKRILIIQGHPDSTQRHLGHAYRWYFRAHSVKSLERNILGFVGIAPISETLIGMVGNMKAEDSQKWLRKLAALGKSAA